MNPYAVATVALFATLCTAKPLLGVYAPHKYPVLEAVVILKTCDALEVQVPAYLDKLHESQLPPIYRGDLGPTICGTYVNDVIIISHGPHCPDDRATIAHELLHYLGLSHHNDQAIAGTTLDPFEAIASKCISPYVYYPKRLPEFRNTWSSWDSPDTMGQ